jgi:hypothetical protein
MRRSNILALLSFLSITATSVASAQLCAGTAPFSAGPVRLAAIAQFPKDAKTFNGELALGATNGAFGGVYVGRTSLNDVDETLTNYGGHIGFAAPVDQAKKVELCPMALVDRATAEFDTGFGVGDVSATAYGLGFGVGGLASTSPTFDFVPFASVAYYKATTKATFAGTTDKTSDDFGILTLGGGFVLNKVVTLQPNVAIPFGIDNEDPAFGITIAINIGKKK